MPAAIITSGISAFLGVDKKGQEFYQISLGGHAGHSGEAPRLGQIIGPSVAREEVCDVIEKVFRSIWGHRFEGETFLSCFNRIGILPFKDSIYAKAA